VLFNIRVFEPFQSFISSNYSVYAVKEPSKLFLKPDSLLGNVDGILRGFLETPGREPRPSYNDLVIISIRARPHWSWSINANSVRFRGFKISNIVIQSPKINTTGFDLLSYDIQRGRDVGLPPYTKIRKLCGLSLPKSFDDLSDYIPSAVSIVRLICQCRHCERSGGGPVCKSPPRITWTYYLVEMYDRTNCLLGCVVVRERIRIEQFALTRFPETLAKQDFHFKLILINRLRIAKSY